MQSRLENRVYAGFFVRMVAYLIDSLIAFIVAGIIKLPFGIAAGAGLTSLKANFIFQYTFIDVVGYVAMVGYFILMTYLTHTTLGKMLLRLEVVTEDEDWTFFNILYRETVGRFLSDIFCIGYLAVIISDKRQGFHDMLSDTYVVYRDMQRTSPAKTVSDMTESGDRISREVNPNDFVEAGFDGDAMEEVPTDNMVEASGSEETDEKAGLEEITEIVESTVASEEVRE